MKEFMILNNHDTCQVEKDLDDRCNEGWDIHTYNTIVDKDGDIFQSVLLVKEIKE